MMIIVEASLLWKQIKNSDIDRNSRYDDETTD